MLSQRLIIRHSKSVYSGVLGQWLCLFSPLKFADSRAKFSEIAGRVLFRSVTVRQLCECTNPSDYRKYFPGQVIRIRLKIEKNSRSFLYIFNSAVMNDLTMTFTSRFKMDAKCANQQCNRIRVADNFWTPPADWVHGYLYFEPGAWIWTKRFRRYLHIVKKLSRNFSLNSARVRTCPLMALAWMFFGIFPNFFF